MTIFVHRLKRTISASTTALYDEYENIAEIDIDAQHEWLANRYDVSAYTDEQILKAKTGSYVFVKAAVQFNDAIEDLHFTINME